MPHAEITTATDEGHMAPIEKPKKAKPRRPGMKGLMKRGLVSEKAAAKAAEKHG